jgi:hypothetical protein
MAEWIPIILAFCLGAYPRLTHKPPARLAIATAGIALIATSAFVLSGEFNLSWTYFLLDFLEASVGFLAGSAAFRAIRHLQTSQNAH